MNPAMQNSNTVSRLTVAARALGMLALFGFSAGFAVGNLLIRGSLDTYYLTNQIVGSGRHVLLAASGIGMALAGAAGLAWLLTVRRRPDAAQRLLDGAMRCAPLAGIGFVPVLFRWRVWHPHQVDFLWFVAAFALAMWGAVHAACARPPLAIELRLRSALGRWTGSIAGRWPRLVARLPFLIVLAATLGYVGYFAYYTTCFYLAARSGYDTAIYDNIFWNILHGGPFFKASPRLGPTGSHFGLHAELLAYALAPLYALVPNSGGLLALQSLLMGAAALPLYGLARRYTGPWAACVVALVYLLHPALHGANLYEFHFLPLAIVFFWLAWWLLEIRSDGWAALAIVLTLSTREDVSLWIAVLGGYLLLSGRRPIAGAIVGAAGAVWFGVIKLVIMPRISGGESYVDVYQGLLPPGSNSFGGVIQTVLTNPGFTVGTLVATPKLVYILQIMLPLAMIPFWSRLWVWLMLPGFFLTMLATGYTPVYSIYYQYSAHWLAFLLPALALGLSSLRNRPVQGVRLQAAALAAVICAAVPISYQFGALLQQNTAYGGPISYKFGMDADAHARRAAIKHIQQHLPPRAKVSCSGFTTPQFSNRPDAYSMTLGLYDAEYIVFPTPAADFIVDERATVQRLLRSGEFGVVTFKEPFALARRGHSTELNAAMLARW